MDPFVAEKEEYDLAPCTYQLMNEGTRILVSGLADFVPAVFPEFDRLPIADKWLLIRNYQKIFHFVDSNLRTHRRYGPYSGMYVHVFGSYTSYQSAETVKGFFNNCPDLTNALEAERIYRECLQLNCGKIDSPLHNLMPTEDEYLALMCLSFWSIDNLEESNEMLEGLATRYRTEILTDLAERYHQTIGMDEGAVRIGGMYCLIMALKNAEMSMKWEYEVYRMLNVFDDNTYMYKLQMHRTDCYE
ncbi:hypothetical protein PMAYCL1PPCAC_16678, partial [Pristionchus mayeri]